MSTLELEIVKPEELTRRATDVAGLCKDIVTRTAMQIQGRKYVKVEGWQSIATAHGCVASCRDVEKVEGGFRAIGEIKRLSDGQVLATAEGFVGEDEPTWFGGEASNGKILPKRPDYAIRAMCQTRAISRVCRSCFAHVVVLMDAGLSTTPAEEVPEGGFQDSHEPPQRPAATPKAAVPPQARPTSAIEVTEEVMFEDYKVISSKPGTAKPWKLFVATFSDDKGQTFDACTFNAEMAAAFDTLRGNEVSLTHAPGRKEGSREILSIGPADVMP